MTIFDEKILIRNMGLGIFLNWAFLFYIFLLTKYGIVWILLCTFLSWQVDVCDSLFFFMHL